MNSVFFNDNFKDLNYNEVESNLCSYNNCQKILFNPDSMKYSTKDFYKLIESKTNISRNTYYTNRKKFELNYQESKVLYPMNQPSIVNLYYYRLEKQLINSCPIYSQNAIFLSSQIKVSCEFFPLFASIIFHDSIKTNWRSFSQKAKELAHIICQEVSDFTTDFSINELDDVYAYWMDLFLPTGLFDLYHRLETITVKKQLRFININDYLYFVFRASFKSTYVQNEFFKAAMETYNSKELISHDLDFKNRDLLDNEENKKIDTGKEYRAKLLKNLNNRMLYVPETELQLYNAIEDSMYKTYLSQ